MNPTEGGDTGAAADHTGPVLCDGAPLTVSVQQQNCRTHLRSVRRTWQPVVEDPGNLRPASSQLWTERDRASSECSGGETQKKSTLFYDKKHKSNGCFNCTLI